jgi:hypothetical protein
MKHLHLLFFGLFLLIFVSCEKVSGDGPVVNQVRSASNFSGIDLRCSAEVYYKQDNNYKVEVNAQQNIQDVLVTEVSDNKLVIRYKDNVRVRSHDQITIVVSSPTVTSLRISGSGNINTSGPVSSSSMNLDISGSGSITVVDLATGFTEANISGSGNIRVLSGSATEEKLRISGSGNIDLGNLAALKANTTTSGSGETYVNASQLLDVTISGSGSVFYKGTPIVNTSISGSGKVIHF